MKCSCYTREPNYIESGQREPTLLSKEGGQIREKLGHVAGESQNFEEIQKLIPAIEITDAIENVVLEVESNYSLYPF